MPIFPPRKEPIKKIEQLSQRKKELQSALKKNSPLKKIEVLAGKYKMAQLSMLKAKIHELKGKEFENKRSNTSIESLEKGIFYWTNKPVKDIISEIES